MHVALFLQVVPSRREPYDEADNYVDEVCKNLLPLIIANGGVDKIKGIGIGAPNGNYYSGTIEFAPNLPWKGSNSFGSHV